MQDPMYDILQKYFGYTTFYPLQEEIIREALKRRDIFVLMPTGGGKSLCYQLPAMIFEGITIVFSPLIALMKDQVDGLLADGIPAVFINSSLSYEEIAKRRRDLCSNAIKILYIAPERLVMPEFLQFLQGLKVSLFAIDESHCISEWGHDFRPEYRQLKTLKEKFPDVPVMALTATAPPRVQEDIISHLRLPECRVFKASFNRKNLYYQIRPKEHPYHQILQYLETRRAVLFSLRSMQAMPLSEAKNDSGIIYCQSRKTADSLAASLQSDGYRALPYHAGLTPEVRNENQERFIRDDVEIIVATIAFGMGIDKPNVRYVIHYDLPKSIEGYYQETGRAGRDGLRSDCILFFSYGDKFKIEHFIEQKEDEKDREAAYRQLRELVQYCESHVCRRRVLLAYFGERYEDPNCGHCDVCVEPRERFDGTIAAQKILSCVYRTGERFGAQYIVDVLQGSESQKILQNRHDTLKTYGVGKEYSKPQWQSFIRELIQLGYVDLSGDKYPVLKLNEKSRKVLSQKEQVFLTKPEEPRLVQKPDADDRYDRELFELLRALRKTLADQEGVPPYVIFHDTTLKEMSIYYPQNLSDLHRISGVGERKADKYGELILQEIIRYCEQHKIKPMPVADKRFESPVKQPRSSTILTTLELCKENLSIGEMAKRRGLSVTTIVSHLEKLIINDGAGEAISVDCFVSPEKQERIKQAYKELGTYLLTPVKERLGEEYSYEELRLIRATMARKGEE